MTNDSGLTHLDSKGAARMVDVSQKAITQREASAASWLRMDEKTLEIIASGDAAKGDVLPVSRIAGITAAKKCSELIPLCHPLALSSVAVDFEILRPDRLKITATCRVKGETGVEMEALTAASIAALTVYDMCKAVDRGMVIENTCLMSKSGGRSGEYSRED